jgi:hypothetical protein
MISVASVNYCERCKCRTLHIPMPTGDLACEHHLPTGPEHAAPPARCAVGCGMVSPGGTLHHVGCGVGAPTQQQERPRR